MRLLLDTFALLRIVGGSSEISERARATCADSAITQYTVRTFW